MNLPEAIRTARWMIRDTVRQALHTKLFYVMLAVTAVATIFCLSVEIKGDTPPPKFDWETKDIATPMQMREAGFDKLRKDKKLPNQMPPLGSPELEKLQKEADRIGLEIMQAEGIRIVSGEMSMAFGTIKLPVSRSREDSVHALELWLVAAMADTIGVLMALIWTAGFLPTFLEPQSATVLLSKPAPRWAILLGKYVGVVAFVGLNAALFVACTWCSLGVKTGVWYGAYWMGLPLLVVNFGVFYAVSTFIAVCTRSTTASAFGTLLFWLLCWSINYTQISLTVSPIAGMAGASMFLLDAAYWVMPKPFDLGALFGEMLSVKEYSAMLTEFEKYKEGGHFHPLLSLASSCGFALVVLGLSSYEFEMTDY